MAKKAAPKPSKPMPKAAPPFPPKGKGKAKGKPGCSCGK